MNIFNSFQAVAFYTIVPFGIQWLTQNGYNGWGIILGIGELCGFIALSIAVSEATK